MGRTAFLFSGQGSQYTGMGKDLCEHYIEAREVYELASDKLGYDVLKLSCEENPLELSKTAVSQPLIYTLSMAVFAVLTANCLKPEAVAGFSLGECSALTAAGAISLENGFEVIRERAAAMQQAAESSDSAMYAIIGSDEKTVEDICSAAGGYVTPVNYNCPGQIVIAGEAAAAETASEALKRSGARVVKLAVNAAFHSRLMNEASEVFYEKIKGFPFNRPNLSFYSNMNGDLSILGDIPGYLKLQMTSPVRFISEMEAMSRDGYDTFVELGPGRTLCGFIRKGIKGAHFMNAEDSKTIENCLKG